MKVDKTLPLISVIVPIYKVEEYLNKCVDSIIYQTYQNLEIILVDDGSPDKCGSICDEYALKDKRIIVIHKENGGLSDARNVALDICKGKYVTFIDSDDYISSEYVEYLYDLLKDNNADLSICDFEYVSETGKKFRECNYDGLVKVMSKKEALSELCKGINFTNSAWGKLYLTEHFKDIRYPKGYLFEDIPTTYKLFLKCDRIVFGRKAEYYYLYRTNAISRSQFTEKRLHAITFSEQMCGDIVELYPDLEGLCSNKLFTEYIYAFKLWAVCKDADPAVYKMLKQKIKAVRKKVDKSSLTKKMKLYYSVSFLSKGCMIAFARVERKISLSRIKEDKQ